MSSMLRRMARRNKSRDIKPDYSYTTDTHFYTCHPTKGWRKISLKRVALGMSMMRNA